MKKKMLRNTVVHGWAALLLWTATAASAAEGGETRSHAVPVATLIEAVAKRTGEKFVVDSRVNGDITLIEERADAVDYDEFLTLLQVNGFAAVEAGGLVRVVPESTARHQPVPLVSGKESVPDSLYVTKVIAVRSMPAGQLVPVLRPLLPQQSHFVAVACSNDLVIVDTAANVRRIEAIVQSLDRGSVLKPEPCSLRPAIVEPPKSTAQNSP